MRSASRILISLGAALGLWCADSLLLRLCSGLPFISCLWESAAPLRLLLRLAVVVALLLWSFVSVLRQEVTMQRYQRLPSSSRTRLFGDPHSADTGDRLQYYCLRLAALSQMSSLEQDRLRMLCHCYDLGDMEGLPRAEQLRLSAAIADTTPSLTGLATLLLYQEENFDGSGPIALAGAHIPLNCRIFRVARFYDSRLCPGGGKAPFTQEEALSELGLNAGSLFDPQIVEAFRQLLTDERVAADSLRYVVAHS